MSLYRPDPFIPILAAIVACGFLAHWAPALRYLGYAFLAGSLTTFAALLALVLLSVRSKRNGSKPTIYSPAIPAFLTSQAWPQERARLEQCRHYKKPVLYKSSFIISESIDGLLDMLIRDFVLSWYKQISSSESFANEIDRALRTALIELKDRLGDKDLIELGVSRVLPLFTKHLKDFYEAERAVRGVKLNREVTESDELDIAIAKKYHDGSLHPAASLRFADLKLVQQEYIRKIVARLLPLLLPDSMIRSRAVVVLIKEIVSCAIVSPLMQILSDPDTWNQLLEAYGKSMIQDRKSVQKLRAALDEHTSPPPKPTKESVFPKLGPGDDERRFERFVRSIRMCNNISEARRFKSDIASQLKRAASTDKQDHIYLRRLETGKQLLDQRIGSLSVVGSTTKTPWPRDSRRSDKTDPRPSDVSLRQVLYDATGLSYFMEFMDRRSLMTLVQFWIVVDGLRDPLEGEHQVEEPLTTSATQWTESDRTDLAQINETYLSRPELRTSQDSRATVHAFIKAGEKASTVQYVHARAAVLRAQEAVFLEMDAAHFPDFKKSDLFYKYLTADDHSGRSGPKSLSRVARHPAITPIPESPSRPHPIRPKSVVNATARTLRRNAASSGDLKSSEADAENPFETRRSLDIDTSAPLFGDDIENDRLARSNHSIDSEPIGEEQGQDNQDQVVNTMEAVLSDIMTNEIDADDRVDYSVEGPENHVSASRDVDIPRNSAEDIWAESLDDKGKEKPNLSSLGLVNTSSRIGVFSDNDLFGDEERFLEDEKSDSEASADERSLNDEIHQAAPGDLGLAEAITALTVDIDKLVAQESVLGSLTRKAELTNNIAELRILGKSRSSLEREIRRKELQRQQYIVQESDHSLYGRAIVKIKSLMVGHAGDGQEYALYVIEVQRQTGENMPAASWAVARRYSEFHDLHKRLRHLYPAVRRIDFPRRRLMMKLQQDFLHKRRMALEEYLGQLLRLPAVCRSRDLRAFLSQSAIVSESTTSREGERRDIVSRIYNSVADGMDEFLGNVPVLDQLSVAGQNLISAATTQLNTLATPTATANAPSLPIAPEDPVQSNEARAELLAFEPGSSNTPRSEQLEPFVKPICDLFLETFDLQRGNNWLRGRAVVVVLHQLLGGTVERKTRESVQALFSESAVLNHIAKVKDTMWPDGHTRRELRARSKVERARSKTEAGIMLATLLPELAGNVVGRANAQAASRRLTATVNNGRLNTHLAFVILDELIDIVFPRASK